jgi:hypothetical protein
MTWTKMVMERRERMLCIDELEDCEDVRYRSRRERTRTGVNGGYVLERAEH